MWYDYPNGILSVRNSAGYREKTLMEIGESCPRPVSSRLCGMATRLSLFGVLECFTTACGKLSRLEIGPAARGSTGLRDTESTQASILIGDGN